MSIFPFFDDEQIDLRSFFAKGEKGLYYDTKDTATTWQEPAGTTPALAGDLLGLLLDKSGNALNASAATNRPILSPLRAIRPNNASSVLPVTLPALTNARAYINTPYGWYKSDVAGGGAYNLPLADTTQMVIAEGLTAAQEAAIGGVFGMPRQSMVLLSESVTVSNLRIFSGGAGTTIRFVGANGVAVDKILSVNANASFDLSLDGLTAPVACAFPFSMMSSATLQRVHFFNSLVHGALPASFSGNTSMEYALFNNLTLTGSIPNFTGTALIVGNFSANRFTGYAGGAFPASLGDFRASANMLSQAAVDAILAAAVAGGRTTGTRILDIGGTGNAAPSATGLTDKATLVSRGWTVTTN